MKNNKKIFLILAIVALISLSCIGGAAAYAYISWQREINGNSQIGHCEIVSISNPTANSKILIGSGADKSLNISLNLDCNINAVVRIKITPKYYDSADRTVIMANNIIYNMDISQGNWIPDDFNLCYYFDASVKNITNLKFINSLSFKQDNIQEYQDLSLSFIIEADILQTSAIDYNNHPWANNAPSLWLEKVKNI